MKKITLLLFFCTVLIGLNAQTTNSPTEHAQLVPELEVEIYPLDYSHSYLNFEIGYFGMSNVKGVFDNYNACLLFNEKDLTKTSITLIIDVASIDTKVGFRDKDLKSDRFFDVEKHPHILFQSKKVEKGSEAYQMTGDLTIKGITKEISFPFTQKGGRFIDPFWKNVSIFFEGQLKINREDFDVLGGKWGETVLSKEVDIYFSIVGRKFNYDKFGSREKRTIIDQVMAVAKADGFEAGQQKLSELDPKQKFQVKDRILIGKRLLQGGELDLAKQFLKAVEAKTPENKDLWYTMAELSALQGDFEAAKAYYSKIAAAEPDDPEPMEVLRQLEGLK